MGSRQPACPAAYPGGYRHRNCHSDGDHHDYHDNDYHGYSHCYNNCASKRHRLGDLNYHPLAQHNGHSGRFCHFSAHHTCPAGRYPNLIHYHHDCHGDFAALPNDYFTVSTLHFHPAPAFSRTRTKFAGPGQTRARRRPAAGAAPLALRVNSVDLAFPGGLVCGNTAPPGTARVAAQLFALRRLGIYLLLRPYR